MDFSLRFQSLFTVALRASAPPLLLFIFSADSNRNVYGFMYYDVKMCSRSLSLNLCLQTLQIFQ